MTLIPKYNYVLQTVDHSTGYLDVIQTSKVCVLLVRWCQTLKERHTFAKGHYLINYRSGKKILGKLIDISFSITKKAADKWIIARFTDLLAATDALSIFGEHIITLIWLTVYNCINTQVEMQKGKNIYLFIYFH